MATFGRILKAVFPLIMVGLALLASPAPAAAHPLGNFTVNRYARLEVTATALRVYYVLDEAEIPAFQEREEVAADAEAFADQRAAEIASRLSVLVDDVPLQLQLRERILTQPPGQGGLSTLRLAALYEAPPPPGGPEAVHQGRFADGNEPDRVGWREVVVTARGDARILQSDAPSQDRSDELRAYPADLLQSPVDRRNASFGFTTGSQEVAPTGLSGETVTRRRSGGGFADLATRRNLSPMALAGLLALGVGFGAVHALAPGHGKTVMAAYLVGSHGRPRDAVALGVVVSLMHTGSVIILGALLYRLSRSTAVDRVYPALTLASGVAVLVLGVWLLRARLGAARGRAGHGLALDVDGAVRHTHDLPAGVAPLSRRGLLVLAGTGGLLPSPSAVLVLVGAFSLGRAALGLSLVAAFSIGLAASLTAVGLALVWGRDRVLRQGGRWLPILPVLGALCLVLLGIFLSAQGLLRL